MIFSFASASLVLSGAILLGYGAIALIFIRFWRKTGERFFILFAIAFGLMGADRVFLICTRLSNNEISTVYLTRLAAFILVVAAIVDKNGRARRR